MKKMIFGLTLLVTGLVCSTLIISAIVLSPLNPWNYNGTTGWLGCLLGMKLQLPLAISVVIAVTGMIICVIEAFVKQDH